MRDIVLPVKPLCVQIPIAVQKLQVTSKAAIVEGSPQPHVQPGSVAEAC